MLWLTLSGLVLITAGIAAFQLLTRLRVLEAHTRAAHPIRDAGHYRPMLRLLSDDDIDAITNPALQARMRTQRCDLFREYLRSLMADYGNLFAGIRHAMVQSKTDRPDLAKALLRNRLSFAAALCRIELRLHLYAMGIGRAEMLRTDVMALVGAINVLRPRADFLAESEAWVA